MPQKTLEYCDWCKQGIGITTYQSSVIPGQYCTSACYIDATMDFMGWQRTLKGRFKIKPDGHGGSELVPISGT